MCACYKMQSPLWPWTDESAPPCLAPWLPAALCGGHHCSGLCPLPGRHLQANIVSPFCIVLFSLSMCWRSSHMNAELPNYI